MSTSTNIYRIPCLICGDTFEAKRKHASTCSVRCRSVAHQVKRDYQLFTGRIGQVLFALPSESFKNRELSADNKMHPPAGEHWEQIAAYEVIGVGIVRREFRNPDLRILKVFNTWNGIYYPEIFNYS